MNYPYENLIEKASCELERRKKAARPISGPLNLHIALSDSECKIEVIEELLEKEDVKKYNENGLLPLHIAISNPHCKLEVIELLLQRGASIYGRNYLRETPLHLAVASSSGRVDVISKLFDHGASVWVRDFNRNTPLHTAAMSPHCNLPVIRELLNRRANVKLRNCMGDDILQTVLQNLNCNMDIVKEILDRGPIVHIRNIDGFMPLHTYLQNPNCQEEIVKELIKYGADLNALSLYGANGRIYNTYDPLIIYLQNSNCQIEIVKELINLGADPTGIDIKGSTLLHLAVKRPNCYDVVSELLKTNTFDVDLPDNDLNTVLHVALVQEHMDERVISLLLKQGADIHARNALGQTCMHRAMQPHSYNLIIFRYLLEAGALPCETTELLPSPLSFVIERYKNDPDKYGSCAKLLLKYAIKNCFEEHEPFGSYFQGYNLDITLCSDVKYTDYGALSRFIDECCHELVRMKTDMMASDFSLYDFIRNSKRKVRPVVTKNVLVILSYNSYPIYSNIIAERLDRSELLTSLHEQQVFTKYIPSIKNCSEIKVSLVSECLDRIVMHLCKEDLLSFILAYYDPIKQSNKPCNFIDKHDLSLKRKYEDNLFFNDVKHFKT